MSKKIWDFPIMISNIGSGPNLWCPIKKALHIYWAQFDGIVFSSWFAAYSNMLSSTDFFIIAAPWQHATDYLMNFHPEAMYMDLLDQRQCLTHWDKNLWITFLIKSKFLAKGEHYACQGIVLCSMYVIYAVW